MLPSLLVALALISGGCYSSLIPNRLNSPSQNAESVFTYEAEFLPELELRTVNFVHTSDIHSWYRGHRKNDKLSKSWNANIGDVASFVHHMKAEAEKIDHDLFFVNSGDDTHGGGLSDSPQHEGADALLIHSTLPYDVMTPGNHELENATVAKYLYEGVIKGFTTEAQKERYLASNVYYIEDEKEVPLARQFREWTTRDNAGIKVAAIGVTFEMPGAPEIIKIQPVAEMVKTDWFLNEFLEVNPKIFLLVGHMSLSDEFDKWQIIHDAIRKRHPHTPIFIFGGHSHNRNCRMNFDCVGRSIAIESGRYLETVGWVSATIPESSTEPLQFVRRYLDPNKATFLRHTGLNESSFDTAVSHDVMAQFQTLAQTQELDTLYGCIPKSYYWDHVRYRADANQPTANNHVMSFYLNEVIPKTLIKPDIAGHPEPYFLLVNNGFMRGSIYAGEFTKDDRYTNIPYKQGFSSIKLPRLIGQRVFEMIEHLQTHKNPCVPSRPGRTIAPSNAIPDGYVTKDSCETLGRGDDTVHREPGLCIQYPPTYLHVSPKQLHEIKKDKLVPFIVLDRLKERVLPVINAAIEMHNALCAGKWRLCKPVAPVNEGMWKKYGDVDSSEAIMKYVQGHADWQPTEQDKEKAVGHRCDNVHRVE